MIGRYSTGPHLGEYSKSQVVRLFDVFAFGPLMILAGMDRSMKGWKRSFLVAGGLATIVYNGRNYLLNKTPVSGD